MMASEETKQAYALINVGDTIYVKGTVGQIDKYDTSLPYCVDFENGTVWISSDNIIDELPTAEPVKPVLPKDVGEELDIAKNELPFDVYIGHVIDSENSDNASHHYYLDNTNVIIKLADAWRYGWTVEKPKRYVLPMPGTEYHNIQMHGNAQYYAIKGTGNWRPDAIALGTDDAVKHGYTVTQADIDAAPDWVKALTPAEVTDDEQ